MNIEDEEYESLDDEVHECQYCNGIFKLEIIQDSDKETMPLVEFCPFCGMSFLDLSDEFGEIKEEF